MPNADDILLLIEVADTSINYDKQIKSPLYARFCIPEYWLIDTQKKSLTVYQKPEQGQYTEITTQLLPLKKVPLLLPDIKFELA